MSEHEVDMEMREAEDALGLIRERFEDTEDPERRGELAAEALTQVERQLDLARERRHELDRIEGHLWGERNRLERFLIHARGREWWHEHRSPARSRALATSPSAPVHE